MSSEYVAAAAKSLTDEQVAGFEVEVTRISGGYLFAVSARSRAE
jgi:hypothetical protein